MAATRKTRPDSVSGRSVPAFLKRIKVCVAHCPHVMVFFFLVWIWAGFWYDDVFLMAREYSFFAFDRLLMHPVWEQPYGSLWLVGRALLVLFAWPWMGGFVLAVILALMSWLTGCLFRLSVRWRFLQYIPALCYLYILTWTGFDAYVFAEPGRILGIPFCMMLILALQVGFLRTFTHRHLPWIWKCQADEIGRWNGVWTGLVLLAVVGAGLYGNLVRPEVRVTARLQCLMWNRQWNEMSRTAEEWKGSCRPVAAYHAVALVRNGRLLDDLFKVRYDFQPIHLTSRKGAPSIGREIYEADCNFHAGLIQAACRNDMEQMTLDGISTVRLRRLVRCALLRGETNLALRYLLVLSRQPFEDKFVACYRQLAAHPEQLRKDPELGDIMETEPLEDQFESAFMRPLFIGYYLGMKQARNRKSHDMATAASLYARMLPLFLYRAAAYAESGYYPPVVADALGMMKAGNVPAAASFTHVEAQTGRYVNFARTFSGTDTLAIYRQAIRQFDDYKGYYPYYYYFGHPEKDETDLQEQEKGGIN